MRASLITSAGILREAAAMAPDGKTRLLWESDGIIGLVLVAVVIKEMALKICVFSGYCEILYLAVLCGLEVASAIFIGKDP